MKNKTNAMRILDSLGIKYSLYEYEVDENDLSGVNTARKIGISDELLFKTLVAKGDKNGYNVFVIPCAMELDLKKCATVSGNKRVEMIAVKELLGVTGYVRGGCSPVGMKKKYPTYFDESVQLFDKIAVSAGARGCMVFLSSDDIMRVSEATCADIIE